MVYNFCMSSFPGSRTRVAVLRGGSSRGYEASLNAGEKVLSALRSKPDIYDPIDIFISKSGEWHLLGSPREPHKALSHVDAVFNALYEESGEANHAEKLISFLCLPSTGSSAVSSALTLNKDMAKSLYKNYGLFTPRSETVSLDDDPNKLVSIFRNYLHPLVVKPNSTDGGRAVRLVYTFEDLVRAVDDALEYSPRVLIEEFIRGREATCSIVKGARGEDLYAFMPLEVSTPMKNKIPDYEGKFRDERRLLSKTSFNPNEHKFIEHTARRAHEALGLGHYSRSDMILTPQGKIYLLETSSEPFSPGDPLEESLSSVGWSTDDFVDHLVQLAIRRK